MVYRKKFWGEEKRNLLEEEDIYTFNSETQSWSLNKEFSDILKEDFSINKKHTNIINSIFELKKEFEEINPLKESLLKELTEFEKLKELKTIIINKEIEEIKNFSFKIKEDIKKDIDSYKKNIENYKKELHKNFLEELGKPISDKNKAIRETLTNLHNRICGGIDDYTQRDIFTNQFKEVVEKINLHLETKRNLLEWVTNEDFWKRDDERYKFDFSNFAIHNALRKLINDISAGCEPNELLVFINPQNKLVCKNVNCVTEKEQTIIKQKEAVESEANEETENGDYI